MEIYHKNGMVWWGYLRSDQARYSAVRLCMARQGIIKLCVNPRLIRNSPHEWIRPRPLFNKERIDLKR